MLKRAKTKQALAMLVTTDDIHDSKGFPHLPRRAEEHVRVSNAIMDRATTAQGPTSFLSRRG